MADTHHQSVSNARRVARAEASAWIVRLHSSSRTPAVEAGFRDWLAAHPENARQFEKVTNVWDAGAVPVPGVARIGQWDNQVTGRKWLMAAAVAVVVFGAALIGVNYFWPHHGYSTGLGDQRTVRLPDGTRMTLNSSSRVTVAYRHRERLIQVDRGEVFFDVAKDVVRPFRVRAGDRQVTALGTSFVVRYENDTAAITLLDGKVAVSFSESAVPADRGAGAARPIVLSPGQRVVLARKKPPKVDEPSLSAVMAWRRGEVILDRTTLADAILEMNRYDQEQLVIDEAAIRNLKVSGIYHTGDNAVFAAMIGGLYGVKAVHREGRIHLVRDGADL